MGDTARNSQSRQRSSTMTPLAETTAPTTDTVTVSELLQLDPSAFIEDLHNAVMVVHAFWDAEMFQHVLPAFDTLQHRPRTGPLPLRRCL